MRSSSRSEFPRLIHAVVSSTAVVICLWLLFYTLGAYTTDIRVRYPILAYLGFWKDWLLITIPVVIAAIWSTGQRTITAFIAAIPAVLLGLGEAFTGQFGRLVPEFQDPEQSLPAWPRYAVALTTLSLTVALLWWQRRRLHTTLPKPTA